MLIKLLCREQHVSGCENPPPLLWELGIHIHVRVDEEAGEGWHEQLGSISGARLSVGTLIFYVWLMLMPHRIPAFLLNYPLTLSHLWLLYKCWVFVSLASLLPCRDQVANSSAVAVTAVMSMEAASRLYLEACVENHGFISFPYHDF
jgi:hypothetical protein